MNTHETQNGVITDQLKEKGLSNSVDRSKPKVTVYYTTRNVSGFNFAHNGKVDVRHYNMDGSFLRRTEEEPKLHHYTKVKEMTFPLGSVRDQPEVSDEGIPSKHLEAIYRYFNMVMPSEITERIKNGDLEVEHSSMSIGDLIQIDDHYFIVSDIGFEKIEI